MFPSRLPLRGGTLDRCDERRHDHDWLQARWNQGRLCLLDVHGRMWARADRSAPLIGRASSLAARHDIALEAALFLGLDTQGIALFAATAPSLQTGSKTGVAIGLREAAAIWSAANSALFAYAAGVLAWQQRHRHCPQCGARLQSRRAGHSLICTANTACPELFPRTDPAVIVLIEHDGHCLLGRQASWPAGSHSALAGFVEPGESLEEAVVREVREEAGVGLQSVRYSGSQPWPFPYSLMVGFHAVARSSVIRCGDELETAGWFSPAQLAQAYADGTLRAPSRISIARHLLREWHQQSSDPAATQALAAMDEAKG